MKKRIYNIRRIAAMILTACMMLGSIASYVPGWFTAFAEEVTPENVGGGSVTPGVASGAMPAGTPTAGEGLGPDVDAPSGDPSNVQGDGNVDVGGAASDPAQQSVEDEQEEQTQQPAGDEQEEQAQQPAEDEQEEQAQQPAEDEQEEQVQQPAEGNPVQQPGEDEQEEQAQQPAGENPVQQPVEDEQEEQAQQPAEENPAQQPGEDEQEEQAQLPAGENPVQQPAEDEQEEQAQQTDEENLVQQPAEDEQEEQAQQPAEGNPVQQPGEDEQEEQAQRPAEDEQEEQAQRPAEDEQEERAQQPAEDEKEEQAQQPAGENPVQQSAEDDQAQQSMEQPSENDQQEQPAEDDQEEKPGENQQEEQPFVTEPESVPDVPPVETEPESAPDAQTAETEPESAPDARPVETEPESAPDAQPVETEPESAPDAQPVETEAESAPDVPPVETERESAPDAQPVETEPESAPDAQPVETEAESAPDAQSVETEPESAPDAQPVDAQEDDLPAPGLLGVSTNAADNVVILNRNVAITAGNTVDNAVNITENDTDNTADNITVNGTENNTEIISENTAENTTDNIAENIAENTTVDPLPAADAAAAEQPVDGARPQADFASIATCDPAPVQLLSAAPGAATADKGPTKPILQAMIDDAMASVTGTLKGLLRVVLSKNMTYEGNEKGEITISAGDREVAGDFKLELVAEDAGDSGREGSGTTTIDANVSIKGLYVIAKSIMLGDKKAFKISNRSDSTNADYQNQGGTLEFIGTENAPNEITVSVGKKSSAIITTTDDDDIINIDTTKGAKSVTVSTGDGVDTINATLSGGAVDLSTDFSRDEMNIIITGDIDELRADTGDSNDTLTIVNNGSAKPFKWVDYKEKDEVTQEVKNKKKQTGGIIIKAGEGDDVISVDVRDNAGDMILDTGDGGDEVDVTKGDHFTLQTVDYDQYTGANESPRPGRTAQLTIENADRSDRITIDTSAALAIAAVEIVGSKSVAVREAAKKNKADNQTYRESDLTAISADDPGASVYLKGTLASSTDLPNTDPITWIDGKNHAKGFRLHVTLDAETTKNDYALDITGSPNNNFTDTLKNKKRVELNNAETGDATYGKANAPFTDYVLKNPVAGLNSITVTGSNSPLLLSNLVLDADEIRNANGVVTLNDVTATNLNVLVKGDEINLNGTIRAQNVRAESAQGTKSNLRNALDLLRGEENFNDMAANMFSVADTAEINVKGTIEAEQDIALVTRVKHNGGMITLLPADVNLINVKVAEATINIADGAKLIARKGNVTALSKIRTTTGYSYNTDKNEEEPVKEGMPLAVTVIVDNALVNVGRTATIEVGADAVLHSQSDIQTATYANSSAILPSPLDVAVTVIMNNVKTDVYGRITSGRKTQVSATGTIKDENVATGAMKAGGLSGGYIAVNVVDQDVDAVIHTGAVVTAGGNVRIATKGNANITTSAISGAAKSDGDQVSTKKALENLAKALGKVVINRISQYLDQRAAARQTENEQARKNREELKKKLAKVLSEDYQIRLVKSDAENDGKGSPALTIMDDGSVSVNANPKAGCRVKEICYRYLEPGKDSYTYVHVDGADQNSASFRAPSADIEVFVFYEGNPNGNDNNAGNQQANRQAQGNGGVQGIGGVNNLIGDAQNAAAGDAEADEALYRSNPGQNDKKFALRFAAMENGSVVTWLTGDDRKSVKEVYQGQKLLLLPNPGSVGAQTGETVKYRLRQDTLVVTYQVEQNGQTVTKRDVVTKDKQGRYVYTVPNEPAAGAVMTVNAEFEPAGDDGGQDDSHFQATGALAVSVLNNDSHALIEAGSTVTSGGQVDMFGFKMNRNTTTADGTAVEDGEKKDEKKDKPKPILKSSYGVGGAEFSLRMTTNNEGAVEGTVDKHEVNGATAYHPKFTMTAENARNIDKVVLSYYSKLEDPESIATGSGTRRTVTLVRRVNGDGSVTYEEEGGQLGGIFKAFEVKVEGGKEIITANLTGLTILQGTTADVSFIFNDAAAGTGEMTENTAGAQQYLIRNPIQISYNALRKKDKSEIQMGTVTYDWNHNKQGRYYFRVAPKAEAGYTINAFDPNDQTRTNSNKGVLFASWTGADGKVQKAQLKRELTDDDYVWFFEPGSGSLAVPEGAVITINAVFSEDLRDVRTDPDYKAEKGHGSVKIEKGQAKRGDEVELTLSADDGYVAGKVQVSWFEPGSASWKTQDYDVDRTEGTVKFAMPETSNASGSYVKITPVFEKKDIVIRKSDNCVLSEKDNMGWQGGKIIVSPDEESAGNGYKVKSVSVTYGDGTVREYEGNEIVLPVREEGKQWYNYVTVQANLELKNVKLENYENRDGKVEFPSKYAEAREVVTVLPRPKEGYRIKAGTLKVQIITRTGQKQIVLRKDKKGNYTFTMPADAGKDTTVRIACEFEPGTDGIDTSLGASLAVGVTNTENQVQIEGGKVSAAKGYSLTGVTVGSKAITEARAGFSNGDFGLAGALAVQVANSDNTVGIRRDDKGSISLENGSFFVLGKGKMDLKVNADASGRKKQNEAGGTGVGAGIAFAVNNLTVAGEIEDGVKLVRFKGEKTPQITGITVNIGQKFKDDVKAAAGATGGSAWVPVAAVDISNVEAASRMGRLDITDLQAPLQPKINEIVKAAEEAKIDAEAGKVWPGQKLSAAQRSAFAAALRARNNGKILTAEERRMAIDASDLTDDEKKLAQDILPMTGKVKIKSGVAAAKVEYNHTVTADASARGGKAAMGGAFIVTWINDSAESMLNQSVSTNKPVSVTASTGSALKAVATAAVSGGAGEDGDNGKKDNKGGADKQANKLLGGAVGMAGKYGKGDAAAMQNDADNRQQAETAESSIAGAGALVLNIQKNKSRAEIMDGVTVITKDKLEVKSANRTEATIKANASTTKSDTGVGVGVALNIVTMENIARIGTGYIEARELELTADIAKVPANIRKRTNIENSSTLRSALEQQIAEGINSLIPEEYTKFSTIDLTKLVSTFAGTFTGKLIEDMGLEKLVSLSAGDSIAEGFANAGRIMLERLKAFPQSLVEPWRVAIMEYLEPGDDANSSEWWTTTIIDVVKTVTAEFAGDAWQEIVNDLIKENADALLGCSVDMVTGKLSGKGWDSRKLQETLKNATSAALDKFKDQLVDTFVNKLSAQIPLLNQANIQRVRDFKALLKDKTTEQDRGELWKDITKAFREEVWDYEKYLVKFSESGFVEIAKKELKECLKSSTVAVTNELLDQISAALDVRFEKEPKVDRHVITTQAISGAGAKDKSGAGSLAVAWVNLNTSAGIADSDRGVNITGDGAMIVTAEELRRIRTHATAAADASGEADNNEDQGASEEKKTGGNSDAKMVASKGKLTLNFGVGGSATFDDKDNNARTMVWLAADKGYELSEGMTFVRNYTDRSGAEIVDAVKVHREDDDYYILPYENLDISDLSADDLKDLAVGIDVEFKRAENAVSAPQVAVAGEAPQPKEGAVTVSVTGRKVENNVLKAEFGDEVKITVDPARAPGAKVKEITYTYRTTEGGQSVTRTGKLSGGEVIRQSSNANESVYVFTMPEGEVSEIKVTFEAGEEARASKTEATDSKGRSIGVGAAVAFTHGVSDVKATIGRRDAGVTAGTLAVRARLEHQQENYSTAGTDPFQGVDLGEEDEGKDFSLDASASVFMLDNNVVSSIAKGTAVTTTADAEAEFKPSWTVNEQADGNEDSETEEVMSGAVVVQASETGATETKASAFATGSTTAVGASVAVNIALSDIRAQVGDAITATGEVAIKADSNSEDDTWSFASAMGADVQRSLNKFADKVEEGQKGVNKLTTGEYFDKKAKDKESKEKANDTSKKITDRLNDDRVKARDGDDASENLNVSTNVLRSQGAKLDAGEDANDAANDAGNRVNEQAANVGGEGGAAQAEAPQNGNGTRKLQAAATVGFNVARHAASVTVSGAIDAGNDVLLTAVNSGDFRTRATAAAMTTEAGKGKTIAAAVGVSVNNNEATVIADGDITAGGDVNVTANLTQNTDEAYIAKLAVQAVSGSVSGKGSELSVAGAAGMVFSHAATSVAINGKTISGDTVTIAAFDKSKLGVRAGGINVSKGANVGVGISAATIWSDDTVEAKVADGATITADSFNLNATKAAVTWEDRVSPIKVTDVFTDSSKLNDEQRGNVYTGLIDIHKAPGETSYTVDFNVDTYALMNFLDAANLLSFTNYYTEAIAGSLVTGSADDARTNAFNGAGSFALVRTNNTVNAALGSNVTIKKKGDGGEGVNITADDATNARMIGGAASGGAAQKSAGVTVTFLSNNDEAKVSIGDDATIDAHSVNISAKGDTDVQAFNAAASVNTAVKSDFTLGGALNILLLNNRAENVIGDNATITSGGRMDISASADMDLDLVSVGVGVAKKAVAAGGTVAYINDKATSSVTIGDDHALDAQGDVNISASTVDRLLSVLASASAALDSNGKAFAGSINLLRSAAKGNVTLGSGGEEKGVTSRKGGVSITGTAESRVVNVTVAAAGSRGKAIGLSFNGNLFDRESGVDIRGGTGYAITAAGDMLIQASGTDTTVMAAVAAAGSTGDTAVGGNLPFVSSGNTVTTTLGSGAFTAGREAAISSHLKDRTYAIAGSIALSNSSSNAVGATALLASKKNTIATDLGASTVTSKGSGGKLADRVAGSPAFDGLYVGATQDYTAVVGAAGVALAGGKGITGNLVRLSSENTIKADASKAKLVSKVNKLKKTYPVYYTRKQALIAGKSRLRDEDVKTYVGNARYLRQFDFFIQLPSGEYRKITSLDEIYYEEENTSGDVTVKAGNDVYQAVFAGGLNFGKSAGVGASVVALGSGNEVRALAHDIDANGSAAVIADNTEKLLELNVNAGGSMKNAVELGVSVNDLSNGVSAVVASDVKARNGRFDLKANNTTDITNVSVALAGAGEVAASPVFAYTGFTGETNAMLGAGTVEASKGVSIVADSRKSIDQYTLGAAFAGDAALSGAVSIASVKDQTNALASKGTQITGDALTIEAGSDYGIVGVSGALAGAGKAAVAVNGLVTVLKASTLAEMEGSATLGKAANVSAHSNRDIIDVAATIAGGKASAAAVTVMALVAGDRMEQEAADQLTYGAGSGGQKAFDAEEMVKKLKGMGVDTSSMETRKDDKGNVVRTGMADDLKGNGHKTETDKLGSNQDGKRTFDVASGYSGDNGQTAKSDETGDVRNAKTVGGSVYSASPKDSVVARVGANAAINARGVGVEATQETLADLFGASIGGGGEIGGGISFAAALLRSNVIAASLGDINANGGDVSVQANSRSGEVTIGKGTKEEERMNAVSKAMEGNKKTTSRSIRVIGLAVGGGGQAGVAMAGGVARMDNITSATLGGRITNAEKVNVKSNHNYKDLMAATVGLAGGSAAGIAASIAGAAANGTVSAKVDGTADISGAAPKVSVTTNSTVNADTVAVTAAGSGGFSMISGVGIVRNDLTQNTSVDRGATITSGDGKGSLTVKGKSTTQSESLLLGFSAGYVGLGLGVSTVNVKPTLNTTVGVNGSGSTALNGLATVDIKNDVSSTAKGGVVTASVGALGMAANVLLVYNDTNATAKAANVAGRVGSFTIDGQLDATGNATSVAISGGVGAVGANISYVDVNSTNTAELDATNFTIDISEKLSVTAGDSSNKRATSATTKGVTGTAGAIAVAVNTSVARNRAMNDAVINGTELNTKNVVLGAYGAGSTTAEMTGVAVGGIKITASVVDALNETTNRARMNLTGRLNGSLDARSDVVGTTSAKLITGGGGLLGIDTNVAIAEGKTASVVDVAIGGAGSGRQSIKAKSTGKDTVTTEIDNIVGLNLGISVVTQVGSAYTEDVYSARVKLSNGNYNLDDVSVTTDYTNAATCTVTPSSSGVSLSVASVAVNRSSATSTAYAGAELALENAALSTPGDVNILTTGSTEVNAHTKPAVLSWGMAIDIGVNKSVAEMKGTQAATLRLMNARISNANDVNVQSIVNKATANAIVATSGADEEHKGRVKLGLVSADSNTATAKEQLESTASILGEKARAVEYEDAWQMYTKRGMLYVKTIPDSYYQINKRAIDNNYRVVKARVAKASSNATYDENTISANNLKVYAGVADGVKTKALVETQGAAQLGLVTVGNLDGSAYSGDVFNTVYSGVSATLKGDANLLTRTNTEATGVGTMPGGLALVGVGISNIFSGVGSAYNMQTSKVLIGAGARLSAANINVKAENAGNAQAQLTKGKSISLGSVAISRQPTESWYDTAVIIGDRAELTARGKLDALSRTAATAKSVITSSGLGIIVSADSLKGSNTVKDTNQLLIGRNAKLSSGSHMTLRTNSTVKATALTSFDGGGGLVGATGVHATNDITRTVDLLIDDGTTITSGGSLWIESIVGKGDDIETHAKQVVRSKLEFAKAYGTVYSTIDNTVEIGSGVNIKAWGNIEIAAYNSGIKPNGEHAYGTRGDVDAGDSFKFDAAPDGYATASLTFKATVNINRGGGARTNITSENGQICVRASNDYLHVETHSVVTGGGVIGGLTANADNNINIDNLIWVDETTFRGKTGTHLRSTFGENRGAILNTFARAALKGVGYEIANSILRGNMNVAIRTSNTSRVDGGNNFTHIATRSTLSSKIDYSCDGWITSKGFRNPLNLSKQTEWCDFCRRSASVNKSNGKVNAAAALKRSFEKALSPLNDIQKMVATVNGITKARYGEEDIVAAGMIYVLDLEVPLEEDVWLDRDQLGRMRLWINTAAQLGVYLLPNSARLYANGSMKLQYVADVIRGDVRGDGKWYEIDIFTALTKHAFAHPVVPIGSAGSLDFSTGEFSIPSNSDFELFLNEVSAKWMIEKAGEGFIRRLDADQAEIDACALDGATLPEGKIVEGLTDGIAADGWKLYWLGDSPATAEDPDQTLVYLAVNEDSDEVDAFRTSAGMIENNDAPVDVSLYLYRDSKSDRMGEEKYNCMFFDTPAGEKSVVKVVTNVLSNRKLEVPRTLKIVLRSFKLDGADLPAYCIGEHFFAMNDGTDGAVSMFDGFYTATVSDDVFESDYIRIEGILNGDLKVCVKADQPIWPQWIDGETAVDIAGNRYVCVDGVWYAEDGTPQTDAGEAEALPEGSAAA